MRWDEVGPAELAEIASGLGFYVKGDPFTYDGCMSIPTPAPGQPLRVLGYVRVSTNKQDIGPEVQIAALEAEAERQGWALEIRREDAASAKSMEGRPVLAQALADLKVGRAQVLAVSKMDRLSRDVHDFSGMLKLGQRQGWAVVALDLNVDTTTSTGAAMAQSSMVFAELERKKIGERTRETMAKMPEASRDRMRAAGRKTLINPAVAARIVRMHAEGQGLTQIARTLTAEGIPTARGGTMWRPSTVQAVLGRADGVAK